jgi:hypothetical protein
MRTKQTFFLVLLFFVVAQLSAQEAETPADTTYWIKGGLSSLSFSQVSLDNWAAGGDDNISVTSFFSVFADYRKDRHRWQSTLDLGFGVIKQGELEFRKSDDKINLVTKYGYQVSKESKRWFFSALLDFRTQFTRGFDAGRPDSVISRFMAPGYLTIGTGIEYAPNNALSFSYQPVTGKFTFVTDDKLASFGAYGVKPGVNSRAELGSFFRAVYKKEAFKNVNVDSRLELFTNYSTRFGNLDVNWQNAIVMKVNKYLSTNIFTQLIYDEDIKLPVDTTGDGVADSAQAKVQFKSVLGVGLVYQFGATRPKE